MADFTKSASVALTLSASASEAATFPESASARLIASASATRTGAIAVSASAKLVMQAGTEVNVRLEGEEGDLRETLRSDVRGRYPFTYAETGDGRILMANGIDPALSWDGASRQAVRAGVPAPDAAPTLSGAGNGPIAGTYLGYVRWLDADGNPSDLSPIGEPAEIGEVVEDDDVIDEGVITLLASENAFESGATRVVVRLTQPDGSAHGLADGAIVNLVLDDAYQNRLDQLGIDFDLTTITGRVQVSTDDLPDGLDATVYAAVVGSAYSGSAFTMAVADDAWQLLRTSSADEVLGVARVVYSGLEPPGDPRVVRRQLLRNTDGQLATFYVDIDTRDLSSASLESTKTDEELLLGDPVPLVDETGAIVANTHGEPPSHKGVVAYHLGRMYLAADVPYRDGHAEVTAGSATVTGVGTDWPASLSGRTLRVRSAARVYAIESVDEAAQTLTLATPYADATDLFARYEIRAADAERRLVYYSGAGDPLGWPPTYAIRVQDNGDEITGLASIGSFLYILERRHVHRFTVKDDPARDGQVFPASRRGCLNQRLWVRTEETTYMLDEQGVHAFSGQSVPVSDPIADLFHRDSAHPLRLNWASDDRYWHAAYSQAHGTIRFFVSLAGSRLPRHALCFNERSQRWWVEEYKRPVTASLLARVGGFLRPLAGMDHRTFALLDEGTLDGTDAATGTVEGTVTAATLLSLTDASADFDSDGVINRAVVLARGRGKGQWRRVVEATATRLTLDRPWKVLPDATTRYVLGGVDFLWRSGFLRHVDSTDDERHDVEVTFAPAAAGVLDGAIFEDHAEEAIRSAVGREGWATARADSGALEIELSRAGGRAMIRRTRHGEPTAARASSTSVELAGVQGAEVIKVRRVVAMGTEADG